MKELERIKKIYDKILAIVKKNENDIAISVDELEEKIKPHLFGIELKEKYGLNIDPKKISLSNNYFDRFKAILPTDIDAIKFPYDKEKYMFVLNFPTGAFMFSWDKEEYPEEFFNQFLQELRSYKPDYEDSRNHILCWKLENAKEIFNSFDDILKKYYEMNKERIKKEKIKKLKEELDNLQKTI